MNPTSNRINRSPSTSPESAIDGNSPSNDDIRSIESNPCSITKNISINDNQSISSHLKLPSISSSSYPKTNKQAPINIFNLSQPLVLPTLPSLQQIYPIQSMQSHSLITPIQPLLNLHSHIPSIPQLPLSLAPSIASSINNNNNTDIDCDRKKNKKNKKNQAKNKKNKKTNILQDNHPFNSQKTIPSMNDATWDNCTKFIVSCHLCEDEICNEEEYGIHLKNHYEKDFKKQWLVCEFCGRKQSHKSNFISHLCKYKYGIVPPFRCMIKYCDNNNNNNDKWVQCNHKTTTKQNLQKHINDKHAGGEMVIKYSNNKNKSKSKCKRSKSKSKSKSKANGIKKYSIKSIQTNKLGNKIILTKLASRRQYRKRKLNHITNESDNISPSSKRQRLTCSEQRQFMFYLGTYGIVDDLTTNSDCPQDIKQEASNILKNNNYLLSNEWLKKQNQDILSNLYPLRTD